MTYNGHCKSETSYVTAGSKYYTRQITKVRNKKTETYTHTWRHKKVSDKLQTVQGDRMSEATHTYVLRKGHNGHRTTCT